MHELIGAFLEAYPERRDDPSLGAFEALPFDDEQYATARRIAAEATVQPIEASIAAVRDFVRETQLPPSDVDVCLDAVTAVANVLLDSGDPQTKRRSRELVELLFELAARYPAGWRSVNARAALIHARAGDSTLARSRLVEFQAAPPGPNAIGASEVRARAAASLLGDPITAPGDEPVGLPLDTQLEHRVLDLAVGTSGSDGLDELAGASGMDFPDGTVDAICRAIGTAWLALGAGADLDPAVHQLLRQAEELVWLVTPPRRTSWARLAVAAAFAGLDEVRESAVAAALASLNEPPLPPLRERIGLVADLLEAAVHRPPGRDPAALGSPPDDLDDRLADLDGDSDLLGSPLHDTDAPPPAPIELPPSLSEVLTDTVLLVAGPELPTIRGAPGRTQLLIDLVDGSAGASIGPDARRSARGAIEQGNVDLAARMLRATGEPIEPEIASAYALADDTDGYGFLAQLPVNGVVNMSWDRAVLDAFASHDPIVVHSGSDELLEAAKTQGFAFTWYAGDPSAEPIAIGSREVRNRLYQDETLARYLASGSLSSPMLFVGVHAADVIEYLEVVSPASALSNVGSDAPGHRHHAVCEIDELWSVNEAQLQALGVTPIGYEPGRLAEVVQEISYLARPVGADDLPRDRSVTATNLLTDIVLTNIGAFERLELQLTPQWNLLLGNNGCGKSTVLRAVALGLCGDHPLAIEAGASLLRRGTDTGSIELQVGPSRFRTELQRAQGAVRVRSTSLTPLQRGNWAVLGFPALRGMTVSSPTGIAATQAPEPRVEDLLPLLHDAVDSRLDDVKQWIINVESRTRQRPSKGAVKRSKTQAPAGSSTVDPGRWKRLLDRFFAVLTELTPGVLLEFDSVDDTSWDVWVRTDDGVVSIDQLSQGMSSIIAWVGCLLQRLYDIFPDAEDPSQETAFVLIDELDAHLHPSWQQLIPSLTRKHFPNVQYLATSHSPLVASALNAGELFVAMREPRERPDGTEQLVATIDPVEVDPHGLRADQVLTSPLFGLMTSRSPAFAGDVTRYGELFLKEDRTPAEEVELQRLRSTIRLAQRNGETAEQREVEQRQRESIDDALADLDQEHVADLVERLQTPSPRATTADGMSDHEDFFLSGPGEEP